MDATVHVGIVGLVDLAHGIDDRARALGAGAVVQIDQRLAVDLLVQDGKIGPHPLDVESQHGIGAFQDLRCFH
jgi:hypothetical protein